MAASAEGLPRMFRYMAGHFDLWVPNALSSPPQMLVRNLNPKLRTRRPIAITCNQPTDHVAQAVKSNNPPWPGHILLWLQFARIISLLWETD